MAHEFRKPGFLSFIFLNTLYALVFCFLQTGALCAQQNQANASIPDNFKLDMETAARLRPQLLAASVAPSGPYEIGEVTLQKLTAQVESPKGLSLAWELRIADDDLLNAYSSPDGTIYVDRNLAELAGASPGLWAAILSHEIAHIVRRDWARRYLYQKSLEGSADLLLGEPGAPSGSWTDSRKASEDLASFCRQLELEADREALMLMVHAGYHPDFVPALHHLLHAFGNGATTLSMYAMHPCWETRDRELERSYTAASIEFEHLWPEWYASPGGNPPIVVFADEPKVKKNGFEQWEIKVPMRCQNLAGAVQVVLLSRPLGAQVAASLERPAGVAEARQLTGCTSPTTTITFIVEGADRTKELVVDVFVLDSRGAVLTRAEVPRLHR